MIQEEPLRRPPRFARARALAAALVAVVVAMALVSCSETTRTSQAFCEQLAIVTGPEGAEVALAAGDPARLDAIVVELRDLLSRAPEDISSTVSALVGFFEDYQRAPREDRRALIVDNEVLLADTSAVLDNYALSQCGLFLQRAVPTPVPSSDPGIEVLPE